MKYISLFIILFQLSFFSISQDTIVLSDKKELDNIIRHSFRFQTELLNNVIRKDIDSIFKQFDFTGDQFECEYFFKFLIDLDSCGSVVNCTTLNKFKTKEILSDFTNQISNYFKKSQWRIPSFSDCLETNYLFTSTIVGFETYCDSKDVQFLYPSEYSNQHKVYKLIDASKNIYFNGFINYCEK